jgi:hypothetical protein
MRWRCTNPLRSGLQVYCFQRYLETLVGGSGQESQDAESPWAEWRVISVGRASDRCLTFIPEFFIVLFDYSHRPDWSMC